LEYFVPAFFDFLFGAISRFRYSLFSGLGSAAKPPSLSLKKAQTYRSIEAREKVWYSNHHFH